MSTTSNNPESYEDWRYPNARRVDTAVANIDAFIRTFYKDTDQYAQVADRIKMSNTTTNTVPGDVKSTAQTASAQTEKEAVEAALRHSRPAQDVLSGMNS